MKKGLLQEKFQRTVRDPKTNGGNSWGSFEQTRRTTRAQATYMPPGMNIGEGYARDGGLAGSTDASNSVNDSMLAKGYQRQNMSNTDEMYTNEHVEEFYGDATVDGETGFLERNNYLDRN